MDFSGILHLTLVALLSAPVELSYELIEELTDLCQSGLELQKLITHQVDLWMFLIDINALSSALLSKLLYAKMNGEYYSIKTEDNVNDKMTTSFSRNLLTSPLFSNAPPIIIKAEDNNAEDDTIEALVPYVMNALRNHIDHGNFELTHRALKFCLQRANCSDACDFMQEIKDYIDTTNSDVVDLPLDNVETGTNYQNQFLHFY